MSRGADCRLQLMARGQKLENILRVNPRNGCSLRSRFVFAGLPCDSAQDKEAPRFHLAEKPHPGKRGELHEIKSSRHVAAASRSKLSKSIQLSSREPTTFVVGTSMADCGANFSCTRVQIPRRGGVLFVAKRMRRDAFVAS